MAGCVALSRVIQGARQTKAQPSKSCLPAEGQRAVKTTPVRLPSCENATKNRKETAGTEMNPEVEGEAQKVTPSK